VALLCVPYSFWQYAFAARLASGPHARDFLVYAAATGNLRTVERLLDAGLPINARNEDGSTALYGAAVQGQMPVIRYLVEHGAEPNIKNNFGRTALGAAREMNRTKTIRYLERHGAK
jgi:ankyrin repeat protein